MGLLKHFRYSKHSEVRASTASTLTTSAALPNSGFAFVDNSQGASAAVAELATCLDLTLEQFELEKEPCDQDQLHLDRLNNQAAKYSNSKLPDDADVPWNCSFHEAQIVSAAFACSSVVYDEKAQPSTAGFSFERLGYVPASMTGTTKATGCWKVNQLAKSNPYAPLLIIAVRGTASTGKESIVDNMVNLNGEQKDASFFSGLEDEYTENDVGQPVYAHAGFVNSAKALLPLISKWVDSSVEHALGTRHILFTGHSAGGAVASLLFSHFLCRRMKKYPLLQFSLITFGSAPVTKPDMTGDLLHESQRMPQQMRQRGLILAVVNEYDLVPRADRLYVRSLVDLYRSIYGLGRIGDVTALRAVRDTATTEIFANEAGEHCSNAGQISNTVALRRVWALPAPEYHLVGEIVMLKDTEPVHALRSRQAEVDGKGQQTDTDLAVLKITKEQLEQLVFCDTAVHKRNEYSKRVEMILEGKFNGAMGWNADGSVKSGYGSETIDYHAITI